VIGTECQTPAQEHRKIVRYRYFRTDSGDLASTVGDGAVGSSSDGHGTHICGSLAGSAAVPSDPGLEAQAALSNGAAPNARIAFDDIADEGGDDLGGIPDDIGEGLMGPSYDVGARIYGMSWGSISDNTYSMSAQNVDKFVHEHDDMLVLVAAGNDGEGSWGPVPHTVTSPATAKNILSVGSSWNSIMAAAAYGSLNPFDRDDSDSQWNMASRIVPLPQPVGASPFRFVCCLSPSFPRTASCICLLLAWAHLFTLLFNGGAATILHDLPTISFVFSTQLSWQSTLLTLCLLHSSSLTRGRTRSTSRVCAQFLGPY
jgi:hypothetical protein